MAELGQAYVQIIPTTKGIAGGLAKALEPEAEGAGKSAGGKYTAGFAGGLKTIGKTAGIALAAGSAAVVAFGKSAIEAGKEFDSSMAQVAATMGKSVSDMENEVGTVDLAWGTFSGNLREYAQEMGEHTAFSATQAADALNYMALAGYDTETAMNVLPDVLNLAAAGSMDLAKASDMVTDTQTAFGISLERTTQMVDEMAKAASTGNTSVEQLGDAFLTVGGLAKELNGGMIELADGTTAPVDGIQEMEIALTAMANAGVKGSEAGTHMRNMLLKLSSPTADGVKAFEDMGVAVFDAAGNMRSLSDIFGDLSTAMTSMTQEQKLQAISDIFNTRDIASAEALLSAVGEDWDKIGESILNAQGAAQQMADTQLDNLAGDITLFKSALEGTKLALSDQLTPALRDFVQMGTEGLSGITEALKQGDWNAAAESFGNFVADGITKITEKLPDVIEAGGQLLKGLMQGITENADSIADGVANVAVSIASFFGDNIGVFIEGAINIASRVASALIEHLPDILVGIGEGIVNGIVSIVETLPGAIEGIIGSVWDLFGGNWDGVSETFLAQNEIIMSAADEAVRSWERVADAKSSVTAEANSEYAYYQSLASELENITDKNGNVIEGFEARYEFITTKLAEATGIEKGQIDEMIGKEEEFQAAIDATLNKQRAEAILAGEKATYEAAIQQKDALAESLTDLGTQLDAANAQYESAMNSAGATWQTILGNMAGLPQEVVAANVDAWAREQSNLDAIQAKYAETDAALTAAWTSIGQYEKDMAAAIMGDYDAIGQKITDVSGGWSADLQSVQTEVAHTAAVNETMYTKVSELVAQGRISKGYLDDITKAKTETETQLAGINSAYETYMGQSKTIVNTASGDVRDILATNAAGAMTDVSNALTLGMADWASKVETTTKEVPAGVVASLESGKGEVETAAIGIGDTINEGVKTSLLISSPSQVMIENGQFVVEGLAQGMQETADGVLMPLVTGITSQIKSSFQELIAAGAEAGRMMMAGMASGIASGSSAVIAAATNAVNAAVAAAKAAADIHSPSRVMRDEVGLMIAKGFALGIGDGSGEAVAAVADMNRDIMDEMDRMSLETEVRTRAMFSSDVPAVEREILSGYDQAYAAYAPDQGYNAGGIYITNNIDGTENPEEFANRLVRQIKLEMRMA